MKSSFSAGSYNGSRTYENAHGIEHIMRWFWVDRFVEFVSGQRAVATKNVTLAEEHLHEYFPGHPILPGSLVLEGLAQTGGMLLGELSGYQSRLVLAKVSKVQYFFAPRPGDQLTYTAEIENLGPEGALICGRSQVGDRVQAEAEFYLAILPERHEAEQLFDPATFMRLLRLLRVYDVGTDSDGTPLEIPANLLAAEQAELSEPIG